MKRGAPLTRNTPMRAKSKPTYRTVVIDDRDSTAVEAFIAMPKLPPLPQCLAKAVKQASRRPRMTAARKEARGRDCMIRVPGYCERGVETVVLCHYRLSGTAGIGIKPDDAQAAFGCGTCHSIVDGRRMIPEYNTFQLRLMHAEGCFRTQAILRLEKKP